MYIYNLIYIIYIIYYIYTHTHTRIYTFIYTCIYKCNIYTACALSWTTGDYGLPSPFSIIVCDTSTRLPWMRRRQAKKTLFPALKKEKEKNRHAKNTRHTDWWLLSSRRALFATDWLESNDISVRLLRAVGSEGKILSFPRTYSHLAFGTGNVTARDRIRFDNSAERSDFASFFSKRKINK